MSQRALALLVAGLALAALVVFAAVDRRADEQVGLGRDDYSALDWVQAMNELAAAGYLPDPPKL